MEEEKNIWGNGAREEMKEVDFLGTLSKKCKKVVCTNSADMHFDTIYKRGNVKFEKKVDVAKR